MKRHIATATIALLSSTMLASLADADTGPAFWHDMPTGGHMMLGGLVMLLFWAGILAVSIVIVRWLASPRTDSAQGRRPTPLEALEERFARGEIDQQEFEQRRQVLRRG